jgi:hypothetical protein
MSGFLDFALVGLVLLASAGYAILALGPRSLRPRFYACLSRLLSRAPAWLALNAVAASLAAASGKTGGACGGCDTCGSEPAAESPSPEVRIPVSKIGKRV